MKRRTVIANAAAHAVDTPPRCTTCNRDPARMNNDFAECSHVDCTHRERCWSSGTGSEPWRPEKPHDPLGRHFDKQEV